MYRRILIRCPKLTVEMARPGDGLASAVDGEKPDPSVVAAQAEALNAKRGMWEKGTTNGLTPHCTPSSIRAPAHALTRGGEVVPRR